MGQLGECLSLDDLRQELENGDFESRLQGLEGEQKQVAARLATLHERRGELSQQLKTIAGDGSATSARLQQETVRQQMVQIGQRWLVLAGVSLALDTVRRSYESDRQPETLAEASSYLKRLTAGRYQRIWTPFGESALCVDDQQAQAWRVEALSRGTREQVYLSLRLALASAYGRRGAGLPLILDDVFVNFDAERARAAAETVHEFAAAGHQVLVFTCHDHIRDCFGRWMSTSVACRNQKTWPSRANRFCGEVVVQEESKEEISVPTAPVAEPSCENTPLLPIENDPDLDFELLYGAPQYDPGYELPTRECRLPDALATRTAACAAPESARVGRGLLDGLS